MPDARLRKCREAYESDLQKSLRRFNEQSSRFYELLKLKIPRATEDQQLHGEEAP